jgi:hypothetical protein
MRPTFAGVRRLVSATTKGLSFCQRTFDASGDIRWGTEAGASPRSPMRLMREFDAGFASGELISIAALNVILNMSLLFRTFNFFYRHQALWPQTARW